MKKLLVLVSLLLAVYVSSAQSKETTYTGTIKGYSINMGFRTAQLLVNNIVTSKQEVYLIEIKSDGTFSARFSLLRNQECLVTFPFFYTYVYFEPGKNLVQDFDIADISKVTSVFKGDSKLALVNNDINKVRPILSDFNYDVLYADIYQLTPEQYKAYTLKRMEQKLKKIDSVAMKERMSKAGLELARQNIQYQTGYYLIEYNHMLDLAYRTKNKLSFASKQPSFIPLRLSSEYYDFLKGMKNDRAAMASFNYNMFINQLMYIHPIYDRIRREDYIKEMKKLKILDSVDKDIKLPIQYYETATTPGDLEKARPIVLKGLLNRESSLGLDLMYLRAVSAGMDAEKDTLSATQFADLKSKVKNKFLLADVEELNEKIKAGIRSAKTQTGYTYNEAPTNTHGDSLFVQLMDKFKGKVVFIDFWATWCVPCMNSIKEMAPLKEELAQYKDIVFLYITSPSSPEKAYQIVMPSIKGEHYRVTNDQYNLLAKQFQVTGIPHYALVNRRGEVVDGHFRWSQTDEIKKRLMALANE